MAETGRTPENLFSPSRLEIKTGQTPVTNCLGRMTANALRPWSGAALYLLRAESQAARAARGISI